MAKDELDKYGVWVKTPPKTVDSEIENTDSDDFSLDDLTSDLPDFSDIEIDSSSEITEESGIVSDGADTTDEISLDDFGMDSAPETVDVSEESISEEPAMEEPVFEEESISEESVAEETTTESPDEEISFGDDEEISLDDFLDGGFSESKDAFEAGLSEQEEKVAAAQSEEPAEETVSTDEFIVEDSSDTDDFMTEESTIESTTEEAVSSDEDAPLDIDLSFDDGSSSDDTSDTTSESISLDDISFDTADTGSGITEESGFADISSDGASDGEEEISLDDFGVNFDDDSNQGEVKDSTEAAPSESGNIEMSVMADDDIIEEPAEDGNQETTEEETTEAPSSGAADDDFDVDALLDNIEDENGNSVSMNDFEETTIEESVSEGPSVTDSIMVEPDTEEETGISDDIMVEPSIEEEPAASDDIMVDAGSGDDFAGDGFDDFASSIQTSAFEDNFAMAPAERSVTTEETMMDEEPEVVENEPVDEIPDSFDEETNSILDEFADSQEEESEPAIETESTAETEDAPKTESAQPQNDATVSILNQIMGELSSLKSEINGLKDDLANLKEKENFESEVPSFDSTMEDSIETGVETEDDDTGFFSNDDGDDTIALSGDELNNILNTAEFETVEGSTEEGDDQNEGFDSEIAISDESETSEELPDEIMVPKDEDIMVDPDVEESGISEGFIADDGAEDSSEDGSSFVPATELGDSFDGNDSFENAFEQEASSENTEDDGLTDAKLDYLNADQNANSGTSSIPTDLKDEIVNVLTIMDSLLENLPDEKINEFARSEQFEAYKKLFVDLGLA